MNHRHLADTYGLRELMLVPAIFALLFGIFLFLILMGLALWSILLWLIGIGT